MDTYKWLVEQEQDLLYLVEQAYGSNEMTQDITEMTTNELQAAHKSIIQSKIMSITGQLKLTDEQVRDLDARGYAISTELAKRNQ